MPKILTEPQLDFSNVLIRPKRSTLTSRSEINLNRTIEMRCNKVDGVPIIAANMDTTGTFEVYETLAKHGCITALHKFYTKEDFLEYQSTKSLIPICLWYLLEYRMMITTAGEYYGGS